MFTTSNAGICKTPIRAPPAIGGLRVERGCDRQQLGNEALLVPERQGRGGGSAFGSAKAGSLIYLDDQVNPHAAASEQTANPLTLLYHASARLPELNWVIAKDHPARSHCRKQIRASLLEKEPHEKQKEPTMQGR